MYPSIYLDLYALIIKLNTDSDLCMHGVTSIIIIKKNTLYTLD